MPWFKVDDKLHGHRKAIKAGPAMALWVVAGSWCSDHLTDGFVPDYMADRLMSGGREMADQLVEAGLWVPDASEGDEGWRFHEWNDRNPTAEQVEAERAGARERMRRVRSKRDDGSPDVRANTSVRSPYPDPVPNPIPKDQDQDPLVAPDGDDAEVVPIEPEVSDDAIKLARQTARMIAANGHPLPKQGSKAHRSWLVEADRLLRLGPPGQTTAPPPTLDEALEVAEWATSDDFWRSNIASIPKLRQKWSQLALKARDGPKRPDATTAASNYAAAAQALRAQGR